MTVSVQAGRLSSHCAGCGTELAPRLLACPTCQRLVHADRLRELAETAEADAAAGRTREALVAWRGALELLPAVARQAALIQEKLAGLSRRLEGEGSTGTPAPPPGSAWARRLAAFGVLGLLLWKFKFLLVFALTKAKLLLLGLAKAPTFFSMLLSFGVYWTAWGWRFALGVIATMYVHEMGHVFALSRYGIRATAPMFVPGLGAFVRMDQYPASAREDARVGLAGPLWGLFAATAAWGGALATGWGAWAATARAAAWLNLFNLMPLGVLDGGRGFRTLSRMERFAVTAAFGGAWAWSGDGLLALLFFVAAARALGGKPAEVSDPVALALYVTLVAALTALSAIEVGTPLPG